MPGAAADSTLPGTRCPTPDPPPHIEDGWASHAEPRLTSRGFAVGRRRSSQGTPTSAIAPAGTTASTWGPVTDELTDRTRDHLRPRGYARGVSEPVRSISIHTADAAILENPRAAPTVEVGTSAGATIAVDLAVRRPNLVQAVIAHEVAWRASRHLPNRSQAAAMAKIGGAPLRGRYADATDMLLRAAYTYRDAGTAWDASSEERRRAARDNAGVVPWDFRNSIGNNPSPTDLATVLTGFDSRVRSQSIMAAVYAGLAP